MRRTFLISLLAGVVAFAPAAQAAPAAQVKDPGGDWAVPSQDVRWARLSTVRVLGKTLVRGELKLEQPPMPGVPTAYRFGFMVGCRSYTFAYLWPAIAGAAQSSLEYTSFCTERDTTAVLADKTYPAQVYLRRDDGMIVWETPYVGHVKKGAKADAFFAMANSGVGGVIVGGTELPYEEVWTGDVAWSDRTYVIGSDLPRR